jgi:hypothetical protein
LAVNASESLSAKLEGRLTETSFEPGTLEFFGSFNDFVTPEPPLTLSRPERRALSDEWYAEVAATYRAAAARGLKPRTAIAQAAGVSTDLAGRWVYEARKRGLLAPTTPGSVRT